MIATSLELRQAFLDPKSRIRLHSDPAPDPHAEFLAMTWEGGFLGDTAVHFNGNLNVLVGGRGTGKSTIIESMRYVLGLEPLGEEARKERTAKVIAQLPVEVATYLLNEKRDWVQAIQESNNVSVILIGNPDLDTPNYLIKRVRDDESELPEHSATSYKLVEPQQDMGEAFQKDRKQPTKAEEAAVSSVVIPQVPAPKPIERKSRTKPRREGTSWWRKLFAWALPKPKHEGPSGQRPRRRGPRNANRSNRRRTQDDSRSRDRSSKQGKNRSRDGGNSGAAKTQSRDQGSQGGEGGSSRNRRARRRRPSGGGCAGGREPNRPLTGILSREDQTRRRR